MTESADTKARSLNEFQVQVLTLRRKHNNIRQAIIFSPEIIYISTKIEHNIVVWN